MLDFQKLSKESLRGSDAKAPSIEEEHAKFASVVLGEGTSSCRESSNSYVNRKHGREVCLMQRLPFNEPVSENRIEE